MATVLLLEAQPGVAFREAALLEASGHQVLRCSGGPAPLIPCPLLGEGGRSLAESADAIVFCGDVFRLLFGRRYSGLQLLHAYRAHPRYARLPLVVASDADPGELGGSGPVVVLAGGDWEAIVASVDRVAGAEGLLPRRIGVVHEGVCTAHSGARQGR